MKKDPASINPQSSWPLPCHNGFILTREGEVFAPMGEDGIRYL